MKLVFRVLNSHLKGLTYSTDREVVSVGRSSDNDLVLKQDSISRRHALIRWDEQSARLEDRGSKNATEVDGKDVDGVAEIGDGSILTFGDVAVQLSIQTGQHEEEGGIITESAIMPPLPGVPAGASATAAGQYAGGDPGDAGALARSSEMAIREEDHRIEVSPLEGRIWGLLAAVMGITAAVMAGFFFLNRAGVGDHPVAEIGTSLRVGEIRIVEVPRGFVHDPQVSPPYVAEVSRTLALDSTVTVKGRSQGMATATLKNTGGKRIVLYVNVLPRSERRAADRWPMSERERAEMAREKLLIAESLRRDGRLYEAKQLYGEVADIVFSPGSEGARLKLNAMRKKSELADEIEERHAELTFAVSALVQSGQQRRAMRRLEDIMELITDEDDIRHQEAMVLHRLFASIIERDRRR